VPDKLMTFTEHLEELRTRLKWSALALVGGMLSAYGFADFFFILLAQPLIRAWDEAGLGAPKIHFANPIEPFFTYLKISLIAGVFIASPIIFHQIWKFIAPGLYKHEKRWGIGFALASAVLFAGGACFGYFFVFPLAFKFFLGYARSNMGSMEKLLGGAVTVSTQTFELTPTLMMGEYFSLVWKLLLAFGLVFELPVLLLFLSVIGLVTYKSLWKFNRYFIVLAFIIGAVLTPGPDIISQILMAVPLVVLYNLSILISYLISRRRKAKLGTAPQKEAPTRP
jgi:sec-independent protein translocase protein TatC